MYIVALDPSWKRDGRPMLSWGAVGEAVAEGCMASLRSSYFCSMAVLSSNLRRHGGSAGGVEPSAGIRGIYYTIADWVSPSRRRGTRVPGGEGFRGGVAFVAV